MITSPIEIRADQFRREVLASLEPARGTYIYEAAVRDLDEKTAGDDPCGYQRWLAGLLEYCRRECGVDRLRILDLGSGNGELTVLMNLMGYDAIGLDVNDHGLRLARILAAENGISPDRFVKGRDAGLPFDTRSFDVVTMISSLEHIDDTTLSWLVPELARICRGLVIVQVPSPMKVSDDHTSLKFVPWMPGGLARRYVALRGGRYRYCISESGNWDVVYRDFSRIEALFKDHFSIRFLPREHSYPPCGPEDAVFSVANRICLGRTSVNVRVPIPWRILKRMAGAPIEHFYPYYNLALTKQCA